MVLLLGVLVYGAGYGVFLTVLPVSLAVSHGFGKTAISLLFVVFYAAISLSQIVAGTLSDRIGRNGFLVWGMALAAAGLAGLPLFPGLWAYVPLGMASIGLGMFCVASIAQLNESAPDTLKGAISGSYYFFWGAGYVLGPLAIGVAGTSAPLIGFSALSALFAIQSLAIRVVRDWRPGSTDSQVSCRFEMDACAGLDAKSFAPTKGSSRYRSSLWPRRPISSASRQRIGAPPQRILTIVRKAVTQLAW